MPAKPKPNCAALTRRWKPASRSAPLELGAANRQLMGQIEEREKVEATLRQMQRLEAVGQLTSGVAHDFNNLLTVVLGNVGFLGRQLPAAGVDQQRIRRLSFMRTAAECGAELTAQLLHSRASNAWNRSRSILMNRSTVCATCCKARSAAACRLLTILRPGLWPARWSTRTQIELVVLNPAMRRDAMEVGGQLTIGAGNVRSCWLQRPSGHPAPGEYVMVRVIDTGTGMTPGCRQSIRAVLHHEGRCGRSSGLGLEPSTRHASGLAVACGSRPKSAKARP